ncbi:MAG: PDZ domain-containing protein [Clostridia bacterium]|nr:PDZ domain-containing protein [Clostridia bacterium]
MNMKKTKNAEHTARIIVLILFVCLVLSLSVCAVIFSAIGGGEPLPREEIAENVEELRSHDTGRSSAAAYLGDLGISGFDALKLKTVERYFKSYSDLTLPTDRELAILTAEYFLDFYYDSVDLSDRAALTDALLVCYVDATGDKYAFYRTKEQYEEYNEEMSGSFVGIGIRVIYDENDKTLLITDVINDSPAEAAGFLKGDYIHAVDGKTLAELGYDATVSAIRGEAGTDVNVTVLRGSEYVDLTATRASVVDVSVEYSLDGDGIGYIAISSFKENTPEQFYRAVDYMMENGAVGIIFDLRDNPGGYLISVVDMIDYLAPEGARIASYVSRADGETVYISDDGHGLALPITVIFNENTASAGELFAAAIRDYGDMGYFPVTTVGEVTYAKGVMQSTVYLSDYSALTFTVAHYNPPSNVNYDGIGVIPDVEVLESDDGTDAQLECAYSELLVLIGAQN